MVGDTESDSEVIVIDPEPKDVNPDCNIPAESVREELDPDSAHESDALMSSANNVRFCFVFSIQRHHIITHFHMHYTGLQ